MRTPLFCYYELAMHFMLICFGEKCKRKRQQTKWRMHVKDVLIIPFKIAKYVQQTLYVIFSIISLDILLFILFIFVSCLRFE